MEFAKLVLRCLFAVAGFGAALECISSFICPEAFLFGSPRAFGDFPAPVLGIISGLVDFLVPGVVVGMGVGMAANVGPRPAVKALFFKKPLLAHLTMMLVVALIAGLIGWFAVTGGHWIISGKLSVVVLVERHPHLAATWWAFRGAQIANLAGGIALSIWTWRKRVEFEAIVNARRD